MADYNNPFIAEDEKVQEISNPEPIDPLANIRMLNPTTGETVWTPNHMVDDAVKSGWEFSNPDGKIPVYSPLGGSTFVRAGDLDAAQAQGYTYKGYKQEMYDNDMQTGKLQQEAMEDTTLAEDVLTFGSSLGRGATFGLTDLISTGIIEGLGNAGVLGYEENDSETIYQVRELSPNLATAAEIMGGLINAGAMTKVGAQAALQSTLLARGASESVARIGAAVAASTAEGMAYGLGTTTADYVMDKPEVGLDTIMLNTGIGGAFGLFGAGAVEVGALGGKSLMNSVKAARAKRFTGLPETLPSVVLDVPQVSPQTNAFYRNVFDPEGNRIATVVGSIEDVNGAHRGAKTGLSIDRILTAEDAPVGLRESIVNNLLDEHPVIYTKEAIGGIDKETEKLFRNMGTKITSKSDDAGYYGIFEKLQTDPAKLMRDKAKAYSKQKFFNRVPTEAQDLELYEKFLNNTKFHGKVLDYYEAPDTLIRDGIGFIEDINKNRNTIGKSLEAARKDMIERLDDNSVSRLKMNSIDILDDIDTIEKKFNANPMLYENQNSVLGIAKKAKEDTESIVYETRPAEAFSRLRELRQIVDGELADMGRSRQANLLRPLSERLKQLERTVAGDFGEVYGKLQAVDSALIEADEAFTASFLNKLGEVDPGKIFTAFKTSSPGSALKQTWAEQRMLTAMEDAHRALKEASNRLNIQTFDFDPKIYAKRKLTDLQEVREAAGILRKLEAGTTSKESALTGTAGSVGASLGIVAGSSLGGPAMVGGTMFSGMHIGRNVGDMVIGQAKSPLTAFSRIRSSYNNAQTVARENVSGTLKDYIKKNGKVVFENLPKLTRAGGRVLGIKDQESTTREDRVKKIIDTLNTQYSPSAIDFVANNAEENLPGMGNVVRGKIQKGLDLVKSAIPNVESGKYVRVTAGQEEDLNKKLEVAFDPMTAFKRALAAGDSLTIQIILDQYPDFAPEIAKIAQDELQGKPLDEMNMKVKRTLKVITQGQSTSSDQGQKITQSNQATYQAIRKEDEDKQAGRPKSLKPMESQKPMTSSQRMQQR